MARDEVYETTVNCHAYKENVALKRLDIGNDRVEVEYEDGHTDV